MNNLLQRHLRNSFFLWIRDLIFSSFLDLNSQLYFQSHRSRQSKPFNSASNNHYFPSQLFPNGSIISVLSLANWRINNLLWTSERKLDVKGKNSIIEFENWYHKQIAVGHLDVWIEKRDLETHCQHRKWESHSRKINRRYKLCGDEVWQFYRLLGKLLNSISSWIKQGFPTFYRKLFAELFYPSKNFLLTSNKLIRLFSSTLAVKVCLKWNNSIEESCKHSRKVSENILQLYSLHKHELSIDFHFDGKFKLERCSQTSKCSHRSSSN